MAAHSPNLWRGIVLMSVSSLCFTAMATLQQLSAADSAMKALFRFVVGVTLLGSLALAGRLKLEFRSGLLLYLRGIFGGISVFLFFLAMNKLGLGKGTLLAYTYPVFGAVLGAIFLKERFGPLAWLAILATVPGVALLVSRPHEPLSNLLHVGPWELLALLGAVCSAAAVTIIKLLHHTESSYAIFFSQCVIGVWLMLVPANFQPVALGAGGGLLLIAVGLAAAIGQLLMTEGYRHTTATVGSLMGMLVPILNVVVGVLLFDETLTARSALGAAIILGGTLVVMLDGQGLLRRAKPNPAHAPTPAPPAR